MQDAYEFTDRENQTIGKAATWSLALAGASFVMVIVHLVVAFSGAQLAETSFQLLVFDVGAGVVSASCYLAAGVLFAIVGSALRTVVKTEGSDLRNMMAALSALHRFFLVRLVLVFLTVVAVVAVVAVGEGKV